MSNKIKRKYHEVIQHGLKSGKCSIEAKESPTSTHKEDQKG